MTDLTLTQPTEHSPLRAIAVSAFVLGVVAACVFFLNPRKTAELSVDHVDVFAPHTVSKTLPGGPHILGATEATEDNLYVIVKVSMTDKLRLPLLFTATEASYFDGTAQTDGTIVAPRDIPGLEVSFPSLAPMVGKTFDLDAPLAPGGTRTGSVVLLFPGETKAAWDARKSAKLTFDLAHQSPQTIAIP